MFLAKLKMWMTGNMSSQSSCMIRDSLSKPVYCAVNDQRVYNWRSIALRLVIGFVITCVNIYLFISHPHAYNSVFIMSDQ